MSESEFPHPGFYREKEVSTDFEARVWQKIRKKKNQRRTVTAAIFFMGILGILFIFQVFSPPNTNRQMASALKAEIKEEIPLTENLIFAVDDRHNLYSIESVSYGKKMKDSRTKI